jgi:hypothetical protein
MGAVGSLLAGCGCGRVWRFGTAVGATFNSFFQPLSDP